MAAIKYNPHIDGLRAIAVLLVIFHHLGDWAGTSGGYVGVDVFFVISGYLITSIVKSDVEAGRFSLGKFYKRRVVRLAPAYFTVLGATTIAALAWMMPAALLAYAKSVMASSLFLANFHMWKEVGGYFGTNARDVPLLHLWSLAVEEQFYLFWPLVLVLGHRIFSARRMLWPVVAVAVVGMFVSQWGVSSHPTSAYYLLPTRFYELAVGAVLAYLPLSTLHRNGSTLASLVGVALIAYATWTYDTQSLFPGYAALPPVLGTALLLRWGEGTMVGAALSTPVATLIGRISYPAYLWHWPIIVFLHINYVAMSIPVGFGVLMATLVLSWITYQWLELPARRFLVLPPKRVIAAGAGIPIAISISVAMMVLSLHGLPARFSDSLNAKSKAMFAWSNEVRGQCNEGPPSSPLPPQDCVLGRAKGNVDFLLLGDSHANHFSGFMDVLGKDANLRGYDITQSDTAFMPGVAMKKGDARADNQEFQPRNNYITKLLARTHYDAIVLAGSYTNDYNSDVFSVNGINSPNAFQQGFRAALRETRAAARRVIVFTSVPSLDDGLSDCSFRAERFHLKLDCTSPEVKYHRENAGLNAFFQEMKAEFPDVIWVDVAKLMCDQNRCATEMDGIPLYRDSGHLNDVGSRLLARKWLSLYGNPLKPERAAGVAASP